VGKGAQLSDTVRTLLARHVTAPASIEASAGKPATAAEATGAVAAS
jgi:ribosomal protein S16